MKRPPGPRYSIEIVPADRGWILETIAQAIADGAAEQPHHFSVRIVDHPTDKADLTFFLPESAYRPLANSIAITYLAHKEDHPGAAALFEEVARKSDYCVTSSSKYQRVLEQDGAKKVFRIPLGVDTKLFTPKLRLGVAGRTYGTGRKGEALLARLAGHPMIELRFTGEGWPYPADYYSTDDLARFYHNIDYLLIPSLIEGGPVSLLEALSAGCPVIAPTDIGLVEDFPHVPFARGDAEDLERVVLTLLERKLALRKSVIDHDWKNFAIRHLELFATLIDERRRIQGAPAATAPAPEQGRLRVLLITHGREDTAKGGPTTRVEYITTRLQAEGHIAEARHNIRNASDLAGFDIVHVFNSWPPQTALRCIGLAKNAGKVAVFSPIALDLADWPIYSELMRHAFASGAKATDDLVACLPELSRERRYGADGDSPFEGIPGHFEALRATCALADHVIFLSEHERSFLNALGAKIEAGTLIHNGVPDAFKGDVDADLFRQRYGLRNYVLCVGRLEYRKNQALLAKAMADTDVPLVLIGDVGDPGYLGHVRMLAGPNLRHLARIEDKQLLAAAYAGAAAFVLPSWSEGAPLAALEAGMAGAPLVLSNRSGEREYFGTDADYISPANVADMRATILRVLDRQESPQARLARMAFLRTRYSEEEHVGKTLALYRQLAQGRPASPERTLVIDVSAHVHTLRVAGHMTGIPLVESYLIDCIVSSHPSTKCITYIDAKDCFVEVDYEDLVCFDRERFAKKYAGGNLGYERGIDRRLELTLPDLPRNDWAAWALEPLRRAGLSPSSLRWLRRRLKWTRKRLRKLGLLSTDSQARAPMKIDFSQAARYLSVNPAPKPSLTIPPGSRILTLGQGWLSNEPLLDRLVELAAGHSLEAYIYDMSYVSGAHYSGWADNERRVRHLAKLLRHCETVYTESTTTRRELAKFGKARGLSYQIVRTKLRGKDIPGTVSAQNEREFFVIYVSSFNRRKNHDLIVNVWRDLLSTNTEFTALSPKLLLIGEIQGETKYGDPAYQRQLARDNIRVITDASDEKLYGLYHQCLFTVYPSSQEGWGIPVQESLQCGKICLVSDCVPAAQEIDNAALIKLSPNDFFGWREAILNWSTNHNLRAAFEEQALKYQPPTWESIAQCIMYRREAS